jgi:spore coat protein U-like protein
MRLRNLFCCLALLAASPAWSAVACSILPSPSQVKGIYQFAANLNVLGTLTITCARNPATDARRQDIWIGMNQPAAGGTATLDTGGSTLAYTVAHATYASGIWTNTGAVAPTSNNNGAITERVDFGNQGSATLTETYTFYFRVAQSQLKSVGVYVATLPVTLRLNDETGPVLGTTSLDIAISIPRSCRFSTPPTAIDINYTAFQAGALPGQSTFALVCTQGTTYTIALDATRSVIPNVELAYGLTLSDINSTGTGVTQGFTVDVSVDPGQAGKCNGSTCTGTDTRTITITY